MNKILEKIPFISKFIKNEDDWYNPKYVLNVIKDKELKKIRKKVIKELKKEEVINPKTLFYLHKYVDSSFNKKTLNIEGRFIEKQNTLDQLYAKGKSEIYSNIAEYYDLIREIKEADIRLRNAVMQLEPKSQRVVNKNIVYNDDVTFKNKFNSLKEKLDWR